MTNKIVELVSHGLVESSTAFSDDKLVLLDRLIETERNETAKWVLMTIRKNACVADKKKSLHAMISGILISYSTWAPTAL